MPENNAPATKKSISLDWLVRGTLTKLGDMFDAFLGRSWKPASSLATSELIERLKKLLDSEAKDLDGNGRFVPHHIQLKMQWDKFSVDSESVEKSLKKLENELLVAAVDHINDRRYHTYAPLQLEIKPDYFTEGVKLYASFDKFAAEDEDNEGELNVTVPDLKNVIIAPPEEIEPDREIFVAQFVVNGKPRTIELTFLDRERKSVGRTKENDLWLDDPGVSKIHAALALNSEKQLVVADTGSTNGTFISGQRIPYGKAVVVGNGDRLKFGTVEVVIEHIAEEFDEENTVLVNENMATKPEDNLSKEELSADKV